MKLKIKWSWVPSIISIAVVVFIAVRYAEYGQVVDAFKEGNLLYLFVAFALQILMYLTLVKLYQVTFEVIDVVRKYWTYFRVVLASIFANTLTPSGGIAGTAVFVEEGRRANNTAVRSASGFVVETFFQQIGFALVILASAVYLFYSDGQSFRTG